MVVMTADRVRRMSHPSKFAQDVPLFNTGRVESLQDMIDDGLPARMQTAWNDVLAVPDDYMLQGPLEWTVPYYYEDPVASAAITGVISADACAAVDLALRWRVLGDTAAAARAAFILDAWSTVTIGSGGDTGLVWSNKWTLFIQAAQLLEGSAAYTPAIKAAMEAKTDEGFGKSSAYTQTENRAMWGVVYEIAASGFLDRRTVMLRAIDRWRELFEHDITNNIPLGEVRREGNGLYYSNFLLNAMTQAAELARFNGEWLYDFKTSDGSTYRGLWEKIARWTAVPSEYPYWPGSSTTRIQAHVYPLHELWPSSYSTFLVENFTNTQDHHGFRQAILAYMGRPLWG